MSFTAGSHTQERNLSYATEKNMKKSLFSPHIHIMPSIYRIFLNLLLISSTLVHISVAHSWLDQRTRCDLMYDNDVKGDSTHPCGTCNVYDPNKFILINSSTPLTLTWQDLGHITGLVSIRLSPNPGPAQNYTPTYQSFLNNQIEMVQFTAEIAKPMLYVVPGKYVLQWEWGDYISCADVTVIPGPGSSPGATPTPSVAPAKIISQLPTYDMTSNEFVIVGLILAGLVLGCCGGCCFAAYAARHPDKLMFWRKKAFEKQKSETQKYMKSQSRLSMKYGSAAAKRPVSFSEINAEIPFSDIELDEIVAANERETLGSDEQERQHPKMKHNRPAPPPPLSAQPTDETAPSATSIRARIISFADSMKKQWSGRSSIFRTNEATSNPRSATRHQDRSKESKRIVIHLVVLIILYIITTAVASSLILKWSIFGGSYMAPYNTMNPIISKLNGLTRSEAVHFPNTTAVREECGHCNPSKFLMLVNQTWVQWRENELSAMGQCIKVGCDYYHFNSAFCSSYYSGTMNVRANGIVPVPVLKAPSEDQVYDTLSARINDRYEYDKEYIKKKLSIASAFTFNSEINFKTGKLVCADLSFKADAAFNINDPAWKTIWQTLKAVGISVAPIQQMEIMLAQIKLQSATLGMKMGSMELLSQDFMMKIPSLNLGMSTDYNPPEVFTDSFNMTLGRLRRPVGVSVPTDVEVQAFEAGKLTAPSFLPSLSFPSVALVLDIVVAVDSFLLLWDMIMVLYRLKAKRVKAFKIEETFAHRTASALIERAAGGLAGLKTKIKNALNKTLGSLRPKHLYAMVGLIFYLLMMYIFLQVVFYPVQNTQSHVYDGSFFTYTNDLYEYKKTNKYNAEFTEISNECASEQAVLGSQLSSLDQHYRFNLSLLSTWAEEYWSDELGLKAHVFNTSDFDSTFLTVPHSSLCNCTIPKFATRYGAARRSLALAADVQTWKVIMAYVLKAHVFFGVMILLRLARSFFLASAVLLLSTFRTPSLEVNVNIPSDSALVVMPTETYVSLSSGSGASTSTSSAKAKPSKGPGVGVNGVASLSNSKMMIYSEEKGTIDCRTFNVNYKERLEKYRTNRWRHIVVNYAVAGLLWVMVIGVLVLNLLWIDYTLRPYGVVV